MCARFAKIIYIDSYAKNAHIQYYQHSSKTLLQEISDPQELFLTQTDWTIPLHQILARIEVHSGYFKAQSAAKLNDLDFFCK